MSIPLLLLGGILLLSCQRIETRKEKYANGQLKARWEVTVSKEGEFKNGISEEFWEDGSQKSIVNYSDNREHGVFRAYFKNGNIAAEINYLEGLMHGDYKEWYDNGNKKRFTNYKNGNIHGGLKTWNSNGEIVSRATFKNGICKKGDCDNVSSKTPAKLN